MSGEGMQGGPWKVPFFSIWTGQAVSLLGSRVAQFALVWWLTDLTGSATVLATASMVAMIPEIALGPIAGAYVDRWDRRKVMMVADGFVALASLWLALMFWTGAAQIWHIYVIMVLRAIGGSFHWPAMQASTSLMVPKAHLARVAGLNQTLNGGLNIVGPPLGALLMEILPLHGVMTVDVVTALLAIVPLFFVSIPQPRRDVKLAEEGDASSGEVTSSIWVDIREGLHYLWRWKGMVILIGAAMIFKIASTPAFSLLPLLVREHFEGGAAELSLLESVLGVGTVLGGLALSVWGGFRRKIYTVLVGMAVFGLTFIALGLTPSAWFVMALGVAFVMGFIVSLIDGPIMAIMQGTVAPEMQGRVFTVMGSLLWITSPFSLAVAGPVSDWLGLQVWYLVAGVLCSAIGVLGFFVPAVLNIEDGVRVVEEDTERDVKEGERGEPSFQLG